LCTFSFKQVVDYYTGRGSHVFVCFADFRKAFDRVNYWKLFKQLIDIGLSTQIVSLLAYWCKVFVLHRCIVIGGGGSNW